MEIFNFQSNPARDQLRPLLLSWIGWESIGMIVNHLNRLIYVPRKIARLDFFRRRLAAQTNYF